MQAHFGTIWEESFSVRNYEISFDGRLSPFALCNLLQQVAGNQARDLGLSVEHFEDEKLTWVLSRMILQMEWYPAWGDEVRILTWPSGVERLYATRDFVITAGQRDIGRATTAWLLLNLESRRPARIPESLASLKLPARERALVDDFSPVECGKAAGGIPMTVRLADLDVNRHVNNTRFVQWILEAIPLEFQATRSLAFLKIHFKREAVYGDSIVSLADEDEHASLAFRHCIRRIADKKELAAAATRWAPLNAA